MQLGLTGMDKEAAPEWLGQLIENIKTKPMWQAGAGAVGGAGLGALSSLWQPKRKRNTLGRMLTGGLLGGLIPAGYHAMTNTVADDAEEEGNIIKEINTDTDTLNGLAEPWHQRLINAGKGALGGEHDVTANLESLPAVGSAVEDVRSIASGNMPAGNFVPEAIGLGAAAAKQRYVNAKPSNQLLGTKNRMIRHKNPQVSGAVNDLNTAVQAEEKFTQNRINQKPIVGRMQAGWDRLRGRSPEMRALTGKGSKLPKPQNFDYWHSQHRGGRGDAMRGKPDAGGKGRLRTAGSTAATALLADLAARGVHDWYTGNHETRFQNLQAGLAERIKQQKAELAKLQESK